MTTLKKESFAHAFVLKLAESFGNQGIAFIINIVLARLLDPTDYGILTLLTIFIAIARVLLNGGLSTALVQKENLDPKAYHSAFYFSLVLALLAYGVLYALAPAIANFYATPSLKTVLRLLALILIPGAFTTILQAKVVRERQFALLLQCSLLATLLSGLLGIALAYQGFAYYALVFQQLCNQCLLALFLSFRLKWWPKFQFCLKTLTSLLSFSWKLLLSSLFDVVYENLRGLVIGKKYTQEDLGLYNRGRQFPELAVTSIGTTVQSVLLSVLSEKQNEHQAFKDALRGTVQLSGFLVFPTMMGLCLLAHPIILSLLGEKWLACVPFLQLSCLDFALYPLHMANLQSVVAKGKSGLFLKLEIIKKTYGLLILLVSVLCFKSIFAILVGAVLSSCVSFVVNAHPNYAIANYGFLSQVKDLAPSLALSLAMGACMWFVSKLPLALPLSFALQCLVGITSYFVLAYAFKVKSFYLLLGFWHKLRQKKI